MRHPLQTITLTLGGDLYDNGHRANIPYPGHSPHDRSLSLFWDGNRIVVTCFGAGDWKEALDYLCEQGLVDGNYRPIELGSGCSLATPRIKPEDSERRAAAVAVWEGGRGVFGTLAATHFRVRHIARPAPGAETARFNPATRLSVYKPRGSSRTCPALVFAIRDSMGALTGVEVTYLNADGQRADDLKLPRKHVGCVPASCAVRLDPTAPEMLVAEGAFTALSASEQFSLPAWALLSTRNLRAWAAPAGVKSVLIAGDNGQDGHRSAHVLAARLRDQRLKVRLAFPDACFGDWNDAARS